jgi:hypothetical protein
MTGKRSGGVAAPAKSIWNLCAQSYWIRGVPPLATSTNTTLDQHSHSSGSQGTVLAKGPQFAAVATRTNSESALEHRQRIVVWPLIALLWILSALAVMILLEKAAS